MNFNLFIFHFKKVTFWYIFIYLKQVWIMFWVFVQNIGFFRENWLFSTKSTTFIIFLGSFKNLLKSETMESSSSSFSTRKIWKDYWAFSFLYLLNGIKKVVHLKIFSNRTNMKISPDFCHFKFDTGYKTMCLRSLFYFFRIRATNYEKYSLIIMVKRFSQVLFNTFLGLRDTNLQKMTPMEFS